MFLDGLSIEKIAKQLDSNNVPTKLGNEKWSRTGLQSILRNEKYVGDALLQKTYTIDCISHKAVKNNGERPKYLVSNAHELNQAEQQLLDIDKARNDFISLIASGELEEDSLDQEFQKLYDEEQELKEKMRILKSQNEKEQNDLFCQKELSDELDNISYKITDYDDIIVRKLIECVKVINKTEIKVIFKDGHEVDEEVKRK